MADRCSRCGAGRCSGWCPERISLSKLTGRISPLRMTTLFDKSASSWVVPEKRDVNKPPAWDTASNKVVGWRSG